MSLNKKLDEKGVYMKRFRQDQNGIPLDYNMFLDFKERSTNASQECMGLTAYIKKITEVPKPRPAGEHITDYRETAAEKKAKAMKAMKQARK